MTQIARLYGGSMYELAAQEQLTDTVLEQMQVIRQLFRENPVNFLKLLCDRGILGDYAGCCEEYTRRYNADHNIATAVVTSAVALSDEQMAALKDKLEKISGKTVSLTQKKDPTVLAGLRVELEGKQLDGTVKSRLDGLSRKLNELII